jgi:tripartite-type tricarboxylate transporter receptor subunit TctC
VVNRLNATLVQALRTPELKERYARLGSEPIHGPADQYARFVAAQIAKWREVVKAAGLKPQ